jgi:tetratricopeptide (TPR) repeat protein
MSPLAEKTQGLFPLLMLLCLLGGCTNLDTVRLGEDRPADLNALLANRQYERAEQLLNEYPYLDTPGEREKLHAMIAEYEGSVLHEARVLAGEDNLIGAIAALDSALQNLPHSTMLNDYRRSVEMIRTQRLQDSARKQLLSRAEYIVEQQELYQEQLNLQPPGLGERWSNTLHQYEAAGLAAELLTCGKESLAEDDLETAQRCLVLAQAIAGGPEVETALEELDERLDAVLDTQQKQAQITRVRQEKKQAISRKNRTGGLLELTAQALEVGDLRLARVTFEKIPGRERGSAPVLAMQERLDSAISPRVTELVKLGDRQYRADLVDKAIVSWQQALDLEPDNNAVQERLDRAHKVLARLEELKRRQPQ